MTVFRHSAVAALTLLGASFASSASAFNITPATDGTTANMTALSTGPAAKEPASCKMKVVEYFSPDNLAVINNQLGQLKNWINDNYFFDESVLHDYLDGGDDQYGIKQAVSDAYMNVMGTTSIYNPGTEQGLSYLKADAVTVIATIHAYTGYAEMLKSMLMDMGADAQLASLKKFDKTVQSLRLKADNTESLIIDQMTKQCPLALTQG